MYHIEQGKNYTKFSKKKSNKELKNIFIFYNNHVCSAS